MEEADEGPSSAESCWRRRSSSTSGAVGMSEKERPEETSVMSTRQAVTVSESSEMSYKIANKQKIIKSEFYMNRLRMREEEGRG